MDPAGARAPRGEARRADESVGGKPRRVGRSDDGPDLSALRGWLAWRRGRARRREARAGRSRSSAVVRERRQGLALSRARAPENAASHLTCARFGAAHPQLVRSLAACCSARVLPVHAAAHPGNVAALLRDARAPRDLDVLKVRRSILKSL